MYRDHLFIDISIILEHTYTYWNVMAIIINSLAAMEVYFFIFSCTLLLFLLLENIFQIIIKLFVFLINIKLILA